MSPDPIRMTRQELEIEGGRRLYLYEFDSPGDRTEREPPSEPDEGIETAG